MRQLGMAAEKTQVRQCLEQALELARRAGVRVTRQRRAVLEVVTASCDHPTAAQIYERVSKGAAHGLSLATVYNTLEVLAGAGVINHLHFDNGSARFCPNLVPHAHLLDDASGRVLDVHLKDGLRAEDVFELPAGCSVERLDACLHGTLPADQDL